MSDLPPWVAYQQAAAASPQATPAPPAAGPSLTLAGTSGLPSEADQLFARVRSAEGTAGGSGYLYYGGQPFTPGQDFPTWSGAAGPQGMTHAAGPAQWEPATWKALSPAFARRFGRAPDFASEDDQRAMTWLDAARHYPGGEARLAADIKAGKLDTAALAGEWQGFARPTPENAVTQAGRWRIADKAISDAQAKPDTSVVWMMPAEYLAMLPPAPSSTRKRNALEQDIGADGEIDEIPSLDVEQRKGRTTVFDQDGRQRAEFARDQGVNLIPVAVHGISSGAAPEWLTDMNGRARPFNFTPVAAQSVEPPWQIYRRAAAAQPPGMLQRLGSAAWRAAKDTAATAAEVPAGAALGALQPFVGAGQLAAHGAAALGVPGADWAARQADTAAGNLEGTISAMLPAAREAATVGDIGAGFLAPEARLAEAPRLARPAIAAGVGAGWGATQPVAPAQPGQPIGSDYWRQKALATLLGAGAGGGLQGLGEAGAGIGNALRHIVSPATLTEAAGRLVGADTSKLTPEVMSGVRNRISAIFERVESTHAVKLDDRLITDLGTIDARAIDTLGQAEAKPINAAIGHILERARGQGGEIPASAAASVWKTGSHVDALANGRNPDIRRFAQAVQGAMRSALNRQLPPDEAAAYSQARSQWRDLKLIERSLPIGADQVSPRAFAGAVKRHFPQHAYASDATAPPVLRLGRAAGETWRPASGTNELLRHSLPAAIGAILGEHVLPGLGGMLGGGAAGSVAGRLAMDRLAALRFARGNALAALRPPQPPAVNVLSQLGRFAAPAATPMTMPGSPLLPAPALR